MDLTDSKEVQKWHDSVLVGKYKLRAPNMIDKQVGDWNDLLVLLTYNIAYDTSIVPGERHRANLSGCYLFLACIGCRPAEIVDNEKRRPKDGSWEELYGPQAIYPHDRDKQMRRQLVQFDSDAQDGSGDDDVEHGLSDEEARLREEMLSTETGKLDEAAAMKKEVLEKMRRILGDEHPNTISVLNNLDLIRQAPKDRDAPASSIEHRGITLRSSEKTKMRQWIRKQLDKLKGLS